MPKNNQKKSKPQSQPQPQTRKAFLLELLKMVGVILAAILVIIGLMHASLFIEASSAQSSMKEYLQKKYGQEFVVENYRVEGSGFGVEGYGVADAYREGGSVKFKFRVLDQGSSYRDNYLSALYNEQEDKSITEFAKKIDLENTKYITDITISPEVVDYVQGTPPLSEILEKHGSAVDYGVYIIKTGDKPEKEDIDKLKMLLEYVKGKNPLKYSVRYVINSGTENSRYICQYDSESGKERYKDVYIECFANYEGRE